MNAQRCPWVAFSLVTILFLIPLATLQAQMRETRPEDFKINSIRTISRNAPNYGGSGTTLGGKGSWATPPWMIVEIDFETKPEWVDDLQLKFYVLVGKGREARMFTGELTLVNVKQDRRHYAAMFMHPSTLERYGKGQVEAVAVQLFHQNRLMQTDSDIRNQGRWWERFSPTPGYLLEPNETPWSVIAHERYEAIKATR